MTDRTARRIRQTLATDGLLGAEALPLGRKPVVEVSVDPAAPSAQVDSDAGLPVAGTLEQLDAEQVKPCTRCPLCSSRTNTVFGVGDPQADLMFVGEGPGHEEDLQGEPFVGRAGQLLDKQIAAMGLTREQVYIANIVKCRPPGNRVPTPDEAAACMPYLLRQIELIQPKVIVGLGATAVKYLLDNPRIAITRMRGQWQTFRGIDLMPTFHPAYLLRQYTTENRQRVWSDLQAVMERLGLPPRQ